ncbi:GNAT family N-acetyltransferase [Kitasatospora sp. NPDC059571]|uniref:GNAT family N-acetyltransferase n=1 Tax=Kitasatospora sp. NPDC059571 TaxID=3346871 RepID=UPI003674508B
MTPAVLTGALVRLRELREEDLDRLVAWWNDPATAVRQVTGPAHPRPAAEVAAMFWTWSQNAGCNLGLSVVTRDEGELVGHVTLYGADPKDRCATLAVLVGAPHQGRGLGTDAVRTLVDHGFTELGLHRIELTVNGDNAPALAAYRRAGFTEEGRRREAVFRHGRWHDHVQMGILDREHRERPERR